MFAFTKLKRSTIYRGATVVTLGITLLANYSGLFPHSLDQVLDFVPSYIEVDEQEVPGRTYFPEKADRLEVASASWCSPCRKLKPVIISLRDQGYDVKFIHPGARDTVSLPTIYFLLDGKVVDQVDGLMTEKEIKARLRK
jgi:hypothetical protein